MNRKTFANSERVQLLFQLACDFGRMYGFPMLISFEGNESAVKARALSFVTRVAKWYVFRGSSFNEPYHKVFNKATREECASLLIEDLNRIAEEFCYEQK